MSSSKYPKRFEILQNDGKTIKFRVAELTKYLRECFVKHYVNGQDQGRAKLIPVPETMEYVIKESGKHTFAFFKYDPAEFQYNPNDIGSEENNFPIWEQDVFAIKHDTYLLPKEKIRVLAEKYAPVVFLDAQERYLPVSITYLLNRDEETGKVKDKDLDVEVTLKFPYVKKIKMPYNDLSEVLPYNGENDSVLDTIGLSITKLSENETLRDALENRTGDPENVTIYYSYIPNPKNRQQIIINYHFFYAYDSKLESEGKTKKTSHIFDRESISIVFLWSESKQDVKDKPEYIVYGAHLAGQTMGSVKKDEKDSDKWNNLQKWKCGRVKVMWEDVYKIKNHPIVAVAQGSHAPYPAPGYYAVYLHKRLPMLVEPAGTDKVLLPPGISYRDEIKKKFEEVYPYALKDLELGSITSNSWNSLLAYSGYIVDIIGLQNAKFPPYTERELNIDKWVNGDEDDEIYHWIPAKVEENIQEKFVKLINKMEEFLT